MKSAVVTVSMQSNRQPAQRCHLIETNLSIMDAHSRVLSVRGNVSSALVSSERNHAGRLLENLHALHWREPSQHHNQGRQTRGSPPLIFAAFYLRGDEFRLFKTPKLSLQALPAFPKPSRKPH